MNDGSIKRLAVKVWAYFTPLILASGLCACFLYRSGELVDVDKLAERQAVGGGGEMLGLAFSNPAAHYKNISVALRRPKIMALGSSRVMQFRGYFFKDKAVFYNAGGAIDRLQQNKAFIENIPENATPEVIILGLDQYYFNDARPENRRYDRGEYLNTIRRRESSFSTLCSASRKAIKDALNGSLSFRQMAAAVSDARRGYYGVAAKVKGKGYVLDGSYRYSGFQAWRDRPFADVLEYVEKGKSDCEFGEEVSEWALAELDALLEYCVKRGIHVVGFLPPYPPVVVDKFRQSGARHAYVNRLGRRVAPVFAKHSLPFFDFTDVRRLGGTDKEFVDGVHGSERTYARMFVHAARRDPVLSGRANAALVEDLLRTSTGVLTLEK